MKEDFKEIKKEQELMSKQCKECGCIYTIDVEDNDGKNMCHFCNSWF